ncbi:MAG: MbcA/ParS/Xre antitoxin family protein [Pseudomonadota bacterium]|nr:MbcA/ParS/Xre antitoxin family protein [Pseudomonadota bacterium]
MSTISQNYVADLAEPDGAMLSPQRMAATLHIGMAELATIVGASRATLGRRPPTSAADRALSPVARILIMAAEMSGTLERAALWFKHQPLPGWSGKTARDLVTQGAAQQVLDYLEATRAGVFA